MNFGAIIKEYPQLSDRANSNYITVWGYILKYFNQNNLQQIESRAEMWTQLPLLLLRINFKCFIKNHKYFKCFQF